MSKKSTWDPPHLPDVVQEVNEGFPSNQCLRVTALDDVVFMECDKETMQYLVRLANAFIRHKNAVLYAQPFSQSALSLLNEI